MKLVKNIKEKMNRVEINEEDTNVDMTKYLNEMDEIKKVEIPKEY